jgi:O-antigen ligase
MPDDEPREPMPCEPEACSCLRCARARSAYRWLVAILVAVLLAPPLSIDFTATRSVISPGLGLAVLYLPWRLVRLRGRLVAARTLYRAVIVAVVSYMTLHAIYYLVGERNWLVFLIEAQWATYLAGFAAVVSDVQPLPNARNRVVRALLLILGCQAILGIVSSYVGPLVDTGAWTAGRFGLAAYRATGTLGNPNAFAGVIAIGAVIALLHPRAGLPLPRVLLVPPFLVALLLSQSKSGWLSFLVSTALVLFGRFAVKGRARDLALALGVAAVLTWGLNTDVVVNELSTDYVGRVQFGERVLERYERAQPSYQLFGLGFRQTAIIDPETRAWVTAHNSYLSFLAEIGLIGFLLVAALWAVAAWSTLRAWDWPVLGALCCMLLHLYSEAFLYGNVYILLMALILGLPRLRRDVERRGAALTPTFA